VHLQQLRRFLHHPELSYLQNQLRVVTFLRWLGRVRRWDRREHQGLLLYGRAEVAKGSFLALVAETLFGRNGYRFAEAASLDRYVSREWCQDQGALILDGLTRSEFQHLQKKLWQVDEFTLYPPNRAHHRVYGGEVFENKVLLLGSPEAPQSLFADAPEALAHCFPLQLELIDQLQGPRNPDGCNLSQLREEMGEVMVYALGFSGDALEMQLQKLLTPEGPPKLREVSRLLRKPQAWLARLGIDRQRFAQEWPRLRQQLESYPKLLPPDWRLELGNGHLPGEPPSPENQPWRETQFLAWERDRRRSAEEVDTDDDRESN
jgi:hypothetical protein